jgi:hypothetical protein
MKTYIIGCKVADIVNFFIRRKWFVKYSCTSGFQKFSLIIEYYVEGEGGQLESKLLAKTISIRTES